MEEDIILPDDFTEPQESQPVEPITEPTEPTKPVEEVKPTVRLKYNHEEKEYSLDDVVPLAQKGLNYDKLQERLKSLENDERIAKYDKIAQLSEMYGISDEELVDSLYNQYFESQSQQNGLTPEQIRKEYELNQKEAKIQSQIKAAEAKQRETEDLQEFVRAYPDIDPSTIKPETWALASKGIPLKYAYAEQRAAEMESKLKIMEQNLNNKQKAPVTPVGLYGGENTEPEDDFLAGFNSI